MTTRAEFAVIGGGLAGLAAAWALSRRGRQVTLLEQAAVGHEAGGSKGSCRIFRLGYDDPFYVGLVRQARPLWGELEDSAGERLLHPAPQLTFGEQMPAVQDALRQAGVACELLSAGRSAEMFPGVAAGGDVLLEPGSAVIAAGRALAALARAVPDLRTGVRVTAIADDGRRVRVRTRAGDIEANRVIVCAGPWTAGLLAAGGIAVPASASAAQVAYFEPPAGSEPPATATAASPGAAPAALSMPIFIEHGGDDAYGLPEPGSRRYKVGIHHAGPAIDPDRQDQAPDERLIRLIEQAARRFLPAFDPRPAAVERCVYDNSPDTDFVVDRIGNVVVGSGTSGHGFKFGPLLGQWLAALAVHDLPGGTPGAPADLPPGRFALRRFPGSRR